ncbi:metal ABC transporter permease [Pseudonocardia alaniniphila]|uniref:Metal ABC transporter permease n=1 Tax=Pseudonocardia alaniniphila TaxID=75291 RepID=A0ABS9T713_9PSEU|nr:metal ABC transporter permease [Pseudonocardia alaniniphila]MCH6164326.1 metal ABC transporter permease [Pseudonocardia alaniniphila]
MSLNLVADVQQMLGFHFMLNALRAGTIVAVVAGAVGYFMVLRRQSFAGHTLATLGFPGAAGAVWLGAGAAIGYFGFCVAGALVIALLPSTSRPGSGLGGYGDESAAVGTVQAFASACGFLFVGLYGGYLSGLNNLLFGTITAVSDSQVLLLLVAGVVCLVVLVALGRPLLFATIDPDVARVHGVPVRAAGVAFLVLLGIATAGASQVTGSLLVFALLVAPAAAATRLTARPAAGAALSIVLALLVTWCGETIAFFSPYPIGFWVTTLAFGVYVVATACRAGLEHRGHHGLPERCRTLPGVAP